MTLQDYNNQIKAQQSIIDQSIAFLNIDTHSAYEVAIMVKGLEQIDLFDPLENEDLATALENRLNEIGLRQNLTSKDIMYLGRATKRDFYCRDCNTVDGENFDVYGNITIGERRFEDFDNKFLEVFYDKTRIENGNYPT